MTRFARASGSKGSNDKQAEDPTSWQEMKASMLAKNELKATGKQNNDIESDVNIPTAEEITSVWADLVSESKETTFKKGKKSKEINNSSSKVKNDLHEKKKKRKLRQDNEELSKESKTLHDNLDVSAKKKNKKNKKSTNNLDESNLQECVPSKKKKTSEGETQLSEENLPKQKRKKEKKSSVIAEECKLQESPKRKKKKAKISTAIEMNAQDSPKKYENKVTGVDNPSVERIGANGLILAELKPKEKKRRKEELKPSEVLINGKPVQLAPFDGFVVQAEDAERLKELRKNMKAKGIPEMERERAIKLERRRAEKALARLKKKVCFHCRGSGHNLSECPQVQEDQRSTGICYKCGSTEHTHYQCRVTKSDDYRFAECFICKEQGHISKQCPDNPRGLYPRGGACATCGDVTHLKKDCPQYLAEKEDETVTVGTRNNGALEALDEDFQHQPIIPKMSTKKPKQHIKF